MRFKSAAMKAQKRNRRGAWWLTSLGAASVLTAGLVLIAQSGAPSQNSGSEPPVLRNPPSQTTTPPAGVGGGADDDSTEDSDDPMAIEMARRQAMARNAERQQQLVADTQKLYQLASELRDAVAKTNKNVLSIDVIKKTDEIDKLAKSIRDKMKGE
jgi:hypothetical protein